MISHERRLFYSFTLLGLLRLGTPFVLFRCDLKPKSIYNLLGRNPLPFCLIDDVLIRDWAQKLIFLFLQGINLVFMEGNLLIDFLDFLIDSFPWSL